MYRQQTVSFVLIGFLLPGVCQSFSQPKSIRSIRPDPIWSNVRQTKFSSSPSTKSSSALHVGVTWDDYYIDNNNDADYIMYRAETCANSETCSLEEAQICLDDILHIQKECIGSGVLSMTNVCNDVDITADIVAKLRQRISVEQKRLAPVKMGVNLINILLGIFVVSVILHGVAADPRVPVDFFANSNNNFDDDQALIAPFYFQEWLWAVRDGHLPLMITQWLKHGGLVVDSTVFSNVKAVPFTIQEWIWSIQNGSFGYMLKENMKYGGLLVDSSYVNEAVPLTLQEWKWSSSDGYFNIFWNHFYENGGL